MADFDSVDFFRDPSLIAFFPRQGFGEHNTRTVRQSGPMYVLAWDWKFEDNAGFYKVFVKLTKGNGKPPIVCVAP